MDNVFMVIKTQVNLPGELKMTRPRIQLAGQDTDFPLPTVRPSEGTEVVVVAGEVIFSN